MTRNKYEIQYQKILTECLSKGLYRDDRTGVGSYSLFDQQIKVDISKYFPIITGRKIYQRIFETEFEWFMNGETNIKRFQERNIKIWDAWADGYGYLGPVYGYQMLNFNGQNINQLEQVIHSIKSNPNSRRHIISLWNPAQLKDMALPPCYHNFQFYVEGNKLNMAVTQRSGDLFLGVPYDICVFSKLLLHVAFKCDLEPQILSLRITDAHIYKNQLEAINDYLNQPIHTLPTYSYTDKDLVFNKYNYSKVITAPVAI
jgi:thymidylate synthase